MNGLAARSVFPSATCRIDLTSTFPLCVWIVAIFFCAAISERCFAARSVAPPTEPDVDFQYTVTTKGRLTDPEEFGEIIVRTDRSGRILRLNDLARIELGAKNYTMESGVDGTPASVLAIYQLPGANLINISNAISAELESLSSNFPEGVKVAVTYDASLVVRASIAEILTTLFIATILVILTVLVFLQDFRATIVPAVTIPPAVDSRGMRSFSCL